MSLSNNLLYMIARAGLSMPMKALLATLWPLCLTGSSSSPQLGVSIAFLISGTCSTSKTAAVVVSGKSMQLTFFMLLPSILLSGFIFPFDGMPKLAQYLGEILPITHFIRITRGIMLREASIFELGGEVLMLLAFTAVALTAAGLRFSRRLD